MSKVFIAGCSFMTGIVFAISIVPGPSTSTVHAEGRQISGVTLNGNGLVQQIIGLDRAYIPEVKPVDLGAPSRDVGFMNADQQLDGLVCSKCKFDNVHLLYGGGAFDLDDLKVSNTTTLSLSGAAANTVRLLELMHMIELGKTQTLTPSNTENQRKAKAPTPLRIPKFASENLIGGTK